MAEMVDFSTKIPRRLRERLKEIAEHDHTTLRDLVHVALSQYAAERSDVPR